IFAMRWRVIDFSPPLRLLADLFSVPQFRLNLKRLQAPAWGFSIEPVPGANRMLPDGTAANVSDQPNATPDEVEAAVVSIIRHFDREQVPWRTRSQPDEFDL